MNRLHKSPGEYGSVLVISYTAEPINIQDTKGTCIIHILDMDDLIWCLITYTDQNNCDTLIIRTLIGLCRNTHVPLYIRTLLLFHGDYQHFALMVAQLLPNAV